MLNCWAFLLTVHFCGKKQVARVKQCVSFKLSLQHRIHKYLPFETRILFYNYHIKSIIIYCCIVLGTGCRENEKVITKLPKKAARLILCLLWRDILAVWQPLQERHHLEISIFIPCQTNLVLINGFVALCDG